MLYCKLTSHRVPNTTHIKVFSLFSQHTLECKLIGGMENSWKIKNELPKKGGMGKIENKKHRLVKETFQMETSIYM